MSVHRALIVSAIPFAVARLQTTVNRSAILVNGCENSFGERNRGDSEIGTGTKRKRPRLDHLSAAEKARRRKLLNREAAQNARDKVKQRMSQLQKQLAKLEQEKNQLALENAMLKEQHSTLQTENTILKTGILKSQPTNDVKIFECQAVPKFPKQCSKGSVEHASLINVPLLKGQDLLTHSLFLVLTLIGELMNASFPFHMNQIPVFQNTHMTADKCPALLEILMKISRLKNCLRSLILLKA